MWITETELLADQQAPLPDFHTISGSQRQSQVRASGQSPRSQPGPLHSFTSTVHRPRYLRSPEGTSLTRGAAHRRLRMPSTAEPFNTRRAQIKPACSVRPIRRWFPYQPVYPTTTKTSAACPEGGNSNTELCYSGTADGKGPRQ